MKKKKNINPNFALFLTLIILLTPLIAKTEDKEKELQKEEPQVLEFTLRSEGNWHAHEMPDGSYVYTKDVEADKHGAAQ